MLLGIGVGAGLRPPGRRPRDWLAVAGLGLAGNTLFQICMVVGLSFTVPSHGALMVALSPVFASLLAWACLGERPGPARLGGIGLAFGGAAVILAGGSGAAGGPTLRGDLLSLGAALAWAVYTVAGKPLLARGSARDVTTWAMVFGALPLLPVGLSAATGVPWASLSATHWLLLLHLTVGTLVLANILWYWALAQVPTARAAVFTYLNPVVAAALAVAAGQERLTTRLVAGALTVLGGVALAQR